eukprot:2979725-Alexandrium_andersonii.AAC.1
MAQKTSRLLHVFRTRSLTVQRQFVLKARSQDLQRALTAPLPRMLPSQSPPRQSCARRRRPEELPPP